MTITTENPTKATVSIDLAEWNGLLDPHAGDTVHVELTCSVRGITHGLDYRDRPSTTYRLAPIGDIVIRDDSGNAPIEGTVLEATEETPKPTPRPSWLKRHLTDIKAGGFALGFTLWVGCVAILAVALVGCSSGTPTPAPQSPPLTAAEQCRQTARTVFDAVLADTMTQTEGQAEVDKACVNVTPTDRQTILDTERTAAVMRWTEAHPEG